MQQLSIPQPGDEVSYFVTFDGDEEMSGPFDALVLKVDLASRSYPTLDLRVTYAHDQIIIVRAVRFRAGREYWIPK